jgi:hypothetical protein
MASEFSQGSVVLYPYLWRSQRDRGEKQGRKVRPACLVLRMRDPTRPIHHLMFLAISSQPPTATQNAIEIPDTERQRANLSRYPRAWITVSEYNYDIEELSWFLEPQEPLGKFSSRFLKQVVQALKPVLASRAGRVDRTR